MNAKMAKQKTIKVLGRVKLLCEKQGPKGSFLCSGNGWNKKLNQWAASAGNMINQ